MHQSQKLFENDIPVKSDKQGNLDLKELSSILYSRNIGSLLVEGGGKLIQSYLDTNLWDELRIIKTDKRLSNGKKITLGALNVWKIFTLDKDVIEIYLNN